ncbi:hypothetical protein [Pelagicoccus mobilis]|uniref:Uncharacterized protein n=1 Tax=Pelagicoccus mobilis TaxID=415221 RepID=A0A934VP24_9BACT|nr:hypothetical protein [Pelagicoccus mobilis]MBK1876832.1 hypothetical protein [Pelagicoccus mobilis]
MKVISGATFVFAALVLIEGLLGNTQTRLRDFELNGVIDLAGEVSLSIRDSRSLGTFWVEVGKTGKGGLQLLEYDAEKEEAVLSLDGEQRRIKMNEGRIVGLHIPKILTAKRRSEIHRQQLDDIYGNEELVRARLEVMVAREERDARIRNARSN